MERCFLASCKHMMIPTYLRNHTMKGASLVSKSLFSSAQSPKILSSLGHNIRSELKGDSSKIFSSNFHIEVNYKQRKGNEN